MFRIDDIINGVLASTTDPLCIALIFLGTVVGLTFGCLPGLTATMGCALLIPVSYSLDTIPAFGLLLGCYVGGVAGGAISACLLNIPGTPSAICTTLDGYPMAQQGKGARALGWAAMASGIGGVLSWIVLVALSTAMAAFCADFSSSEYAVVALLGLLLTMTMSKKSFTKGIVTAALGIMLGCVGIDIIYGNFRFTFGTTSLLSGFDTVPVSIGAFALPQIIGLFVHPVDRKQPKVSARGFLPSIRDIWKHKWNIIRSSIIGTVIGIIPAIGQVTASFFAYDLAKRAGSTEKEAFGEGNCDGVIAPETANNAVCGGAMVPLLTLGIPGDQTTAILLGGLMLHGLRAGPQLFIENYDVVVGLYTTLLIATIFMVIAQTFGIKLFCKMLATPCNFLAPLLLVLAMVGCFAIRSNPFDCVVCLCVGIVCYFMDRAGYSVTCLVMGLVLGSTFEAELRRTLLTTHNDWSVFITRPFSCVMTLLCAAVIIWTIVRQIRASHGKVGKYDEFED